MPQRKAAGATSDTSENVELASECLATLLELAPVLTASEQAVLQLQALLLALFVMLLQANERERGREGRLEDDCGVSPPVGATRAPDFKHASR